VRLGWKQAYDFDKGLDLTIDWYMSNDEWISRYAAARTGSGSGRITGGGESTAANDQNAVKVLTKTTLICINS